MRLPSFQANARVKKRKRERILYFVEVRSLDLVSWVEGVHTLMLVNYPPCQFDLEVSSIFQSEWSEALGKFAFNGTWPFFLQCFKIPSYQDCDGQAFLNQNLKRLFNQLMTGLRITHQRFNSSRSCQHKTTMAQQKVVY